MKELRFFKCSVCGQMICMVNSTNLPITCCGKEMVEIKPSYVDTNMDKHVPIFKVCCGKVKVKIGKVEHPMEIKHNINWVLVQTNKGHYTRFLNSMDCPYVTFKLCKNERVCAVYCYCNIHGLWVNKVEKCNYDK